MNCNKSLVSFGAQGNLAEVSQSKYIQEKGGEILWLLKDIRCQEFGGIDRESEPKQFVSDKFKSKLVDLSKNNTRSVMVSFNISHFESSNIIGFSLTELISFAFNAGRNPNVSLIDVSDNNVESDDLKSVEIISIIYYYFILGVALREKDPNGS